MAFEMSFTDEFGDVYPNSYWKVVQCNICRADETGLVSFYGYANAANSGKRIIGQKHYVIDSALYNQYFLAEALDPQGENPYRAAYLMASAVLDSPPASGEQSGASFFAGAVQA